MGEVTKLERLSLSQILQKCGYMCTEYEVPICMLNSVRQQVREIIPEVSGVYIPTRPTPYLLKCSATTAYAILNLATFRQIYQGCLAQLDSRCKQY